MKNKILLLGCIMLAACSYVYAGPPEEGKTIFMSRCAGCHNVNKLLTGPALAGVHERHSIDWIINFVRSSQTLVKKGDKEAVALFQKFNKVPMPDHPDLTPENIRNIVDYIKSATVAVTPGPETPFAKPGKRMTPYVPLSITKDYIVFSVFLFVVALLIMILLLAVRMKDFQRNAE